MTSSTPKLNATIDETLCSPQMSESRDPASPMRAYRTMPRACVQGSAYAAQGLVLPGAALETYAAAKTPEPADVATSDTTIPTHATSSNQARRR